MTDDWPPSFEEPREPVRNCRHPKWKRLRVDPQTNLPLADDAELCGQCLAVIDAARRVRGRRSRNRGNAIEREVGKRLGLRRVGQFGGPEDLSDDLFAAQVKSGGSFPERLWGWLKQVPTKAGQTALLVVTDAPGPGRRRRAVVVIDIDDWMLLHGRDSDGPIQPVDPRLEELAG